MSHPTPTPTIEHAKTFLDLLAQYGLVAGLGTQEPGKMCIEATWCYVLGLPHGDDPKCVGSEVRKTKILLNDKNWSSPQARAKGLAKLGLAQIGSDQIDQKVYKDLWFLRCAQQLSPIILRWLVGNKNKPQKWLKLADKLEKSQTIQEAIKHAYGYDYGYGYDYAYAYDYIYAYDYGYAYGYDYGYGYGYGYTRDEWLTKTADMTTAVLIELNSPGCTWLHLVKQ